jgi:hypothetical protein
VRVGVGVAEIVYGHDPKFIGASAFENGAQYISTDSTVTVDGDSDGHFVSSGNSIFVGASAARE